MAENEAVLTMRSALRPTPVILNDEEHEAVLAEIDVLMDGEPAANSPNGFRLRLLARISAEFEHEHWPIEFSSPPEIVAEAMKRHGYKRADLAGVLGGASRVADILNARRALNLAQARQLSQFLRVPLEVLAREYTLAPVTKARSTPTATSKKPVYVQGKHGPWGAPAQGHETMAARRSASANRPMAKARKMRTRA